MSHRTCKYHGRGCTHPGYCLERHPHKYEGDGHEEKIDAQRLTIGCVVRMCGRDGNLSSFSDTVVIGIYISYSNRRQVAEKKADKEHFLLLEDAMSAAKKDDYVYVKLARPMLYCDNVFGSMPGWAMKAEVYETDAPRLLEMFKVVVMSTGEYDTRHVRDPLHKWEVKVSGAGSEGWAPKDGLVYSDLSEGGARESFKIHRQMAQGAYGRKGGETVHLICDGEIVDEYVGGM